MGIFNLTTNFERILPDSYFFHLFFVIFNIYFLQLNFYLVIKSFIIIHCMQQGCIHIYSGEGKGKTTAAVGLAIRAKSRGLRVLFAQFMKGSADRGEISILKKLSVTTKKFPQIHPPYFNPDIDREKLRKEVIKALEYTKKVMKKGNFDMVILDEFNYLLAESLLTEDEAMDLISHKPDHLELVLTGRGATKRLIQTADYITDMKMIKHPFSKGIKARKGIEY